MSKTITIEAAGNGVVVKEFLCDAVVFKHSEAEEALTEIYRRFFPWEIGDTINIKRRSKEVTP